jgi:hypothetical protein
MLIRDMRQVTAKLKALTGVTSSCLRFMKKPGNYRRPTNLLESAIAVQVYEQSAST